MTALIQVQCVAVAWVGLLLVFLGVGRIVRWLVCRQTFDAEGSFLDLWVGWGAVVAFLQMWHFLLPVDSRALGLVVSLGMLGLGVTCRGHGTRVRPAARTAGAALIAVWLAAVWLANHSVRQPVILDSNLYHLSAVRWAADYPLVPGLGNLHGRLAFNSSFFLYAALLDWGMFTHKSHQLASGSLMLIAVCQSLYSAWQLIRSAEGGASAAVFRALLAAPLLAWVVNSGYASSPSPDVAVFVLGLVVMGLLLDLVDADFKPRTTGGSVDCLLLAVMLLAAVGVTAKLNFGVFALAASAAAYMLGRRRFASDRSVARFVGWAAGVAVSVLVPWMARGVVLSGYPLYPLPRLAFPVDWRLPAHAVADQARWIKAWGRTPWESPDDVLASWSWLWPWANRVLAEHVFSLVLPLSLCVLAAALFRLLPSREGRRARVPAVLFAVPAVALAAWFFSVPDPRFAASLPWALGILSLTAALRDVDTPYVKSVFATYTVLILAQTVNPIAAVHTWKDPNAARSFPVRGRTTRSGLVVWVSAEGDLCGDAALPCTPYFSSNLELRVSGNMSKGFRKAAVGKPR